MFLFKIFLICIGSTNQASLHYSVILFQKSAQLLYLVQRPNLSRVRIFQITSIPCFYFESIVERDFVGLDLQTPRIVYLVSEADITSENEEELPFLKSTMKAFPGICIESDLLDAHLYVLKNWVCKYIFENR